MVSRIYTWRWPTMVLVGCLLGGPALAGTRPATDTASQLREAQAHFDELARHFPPTHPDVIAARKQLEEVKSRQALEKRCQDGDVTAARALEELQRQQRQEWAQELIHAGRGILGESTGGLGPREP